MAYRAKKDLISDNFYQCNQYLGKQVTEICDVKSVISRYMISDSNTEFPDSTVYSTYNDIYDIFHGKYNANVDNEIRIGKVKGRLNSDDANYAKDLGVICEDISSYGKDLDYKFGDLLNVSGGINANFVDSVALVFFKRRLTREEYERYEVLLVQTQIGDPVSRMSQADKEEFISLYETLYPADAKSMESMANLFANDGYSGYELDVLNIKLLAYTAPEPYKSIYIDNIDLVKEGDLHYTEWPNASGGKFNINVANFSTPRTSETYGTFFHETSHCIDYFLGENASFTTEYRDSLTNLSLNDALEMDVRQRINNEIDNYLLTNTSLTPAEVAELRLYVEDSIMNQVDFKKYGTPDFTMIVDSNSSLSPSTVENCYNYVRNRVNSQIIGFAGDNYGGLTGNTFQGSSLHESIIRDNHDGTFTYRVYWISGGINADGSDLYITLDNGERYDETIDITDSNQWSSSDLDERVIMSDGEVTYKGSIASEFFANAMEANITGNSRDLRAYNFYNTDTIDYFENMLNSLN